MNNKYGYSREILEVFEALAKCFKDIKDAAEKATNIVDEAFLQQLNNRRKTDGWQDSERPEADRGK